MAEKLDAEVVVNRLVTLIQANLNTKLSAIDTEKNDGITLKHFTDPVAADPNAVPPVLFNPGAYAILTTDSYVMNFNPFMYIGVMIPNSSGIGTGTQMDLSIDLVVVLQIEGGDTNVWKRMLRYQRAIKEVVQSNWEDSNIPGFLLIESLEPRPLEELGGGNYMGVGIRVKTSLA